MRTLLSAVFCLITLQHSAIALERKEGAYFCRATAVGGLSFNKNTNSWEGTAFNPKSRFLIKMIYKNSRQAPIYGSITAPVDDYEVSVTQEGKNVAVPCLQNGNKLAELDEYGWIACSAGLQDYKFNFKSNRYLRTYLIGYADGRDENADTPSVEGGVCTRFN
jgi:hypothetical protein